VTDAACDMSAAFTKGITEHLPKAAITYDRFHVTKLIIEALEETRRAEQQEGGWRHQLLKGHRWALLRNEANQTDRQAQAASVISMPMLASDAWTGIDWTWP